MPRARLRPEYAWPYPRLRADRWYPVREGSFAADDPDWLWLVGDVHPEYVYRAHAELDEPTDTATGAREARLRPEFAAQYAMPRAGIWIRARDLLRQLVPGLAPPIADRRAGRLPSEHFEFRDPPADPAEPPADPPLTG